MNKLMILGLLVGGFVSQNSFGELCDISCAGNHKNADGSICIDIQIEGMGPSTIEKESCAAAGLKPLDGFWIKMREDRARESMAKYKAGTSSRGAN